MKKIYTMALLLMMAAMPALAQSTFTLTAPQAPAAMGLKGGIHITPDHAATIQKAPAKAEADEELAMKIGYCGDPNSAYAINAGQIGMAVMFPQKLMADYKGGQITAINVCSPINGRLSQTSYVNSLTKCKVFVTESLGGTPIAETEGTLSEVGLDYNAVKLATPYNITGDKDVYVCVMWDKVTANDFPVVTDGAQPENNYSGYLYSRFKDVSQQGSVILQEEYEWKQFNIYAGDFCLTATVQADFLPTNTASIVAQDMPLSVKPGEQFQYAVLVYNEAANQIRNVDLSLKIGDSEVQTVNSNIYTNDGNAAQITIGNDEYGVAFGSFVYNNEGQNLPFTAYISKVNGVDNPKANQKIKGVIVASLSSGYPMNVVVEELTSTTCPMCPIGITGMETMKEKYGADGRFIPIAVHCPVPTAGDPMNVCVRNSSYFEFYRDIQTIYGGASAPSAYIMRRLENLVSPSPENLEVQFAEWKDVPAVVKVEANLTEIANTEETDDSKSVKLDVTVTPSKDLTGNYGVIYSIVEDNVGPTDDKDKNAFKQQNGFSGMGDYYGWGQKPSYVEMKFNDVARRGSVYKPASDARFTELKAETPVSYTTNVDLSYVDDLSKYSVVAMFVNTDNGYIENACIVKSPTLTSVEGIEAEAKAPVAVGMEGALLMFQTGDVYSVDGRLVAKDANGTVNLPAGIYLVATPAGNAKVMVR